MRAVELNGKEELRVEEVPEPSPGPGQVKLRNAFAGICGSDLHLYYAPEQMGLDHEHAHPLTGGKLPQILGHEFAGTVAELGEGVTDVAVGDRVAVWPIYYCGKCAACRQGRFNACRQIAFHGVNSIGGGMSDFTVVPASMLHKLPDNVDLKMGALVEPMAVAWHGVKQGRVPEGGTALIAGAGPIGIGIYFALKAQGAGTVIVSEPSEDRRNAIRAVGAEFVVDPVNEDLAAKVLELTNGDGVDAAFDAAGAGPAITSALPLLTPGGRLVLVAIGEKPVELFTTPIVMAETEIIGSLAYLPEDFDEVIAAMSAGEYDVTGWVDEIPFDEVEHAIHRLREGKGMKVLVHG